jgi:hypothetical protein
VGKGGVNSEVDQERVARADVAGQVDHRVRARPKG